MFNMAPHGKELSEDLRIRIIALHKDGLGYKKFGSEAEDDALPSETVFHITTTPTHRQDDNCLAAEGEGEGDGVAKYVSRPEPYWALVGHPQVEAGEAPCV